MSDIFKPKLRDLANPFPPDPITKEERRAQRLAPEIVAHWIKVVRLASGYVPEGTGPCDYKPWVTALRHVQDIPRPPERVAKRDEYIDRYPNLMGFAETVGQPGWPEPREDLIEFALTFLEADVMLFRSGYAKRHLVRRLQQSALNQVQISRISLLLQRAVIQGTGLEEFRAYKRLSAHLVVKGQLPEWEEELTEMAQGVVLTSDNADGRLWLMMEKAAQSLSEDDRIRFVKFNGLGAPKWGLNWPEMDRVVRAGKNLNAPDERVRRNACLMLEAIKRRRGEM